VSARRVRTRRIVRAILSDAPGASIVVVLLAALLAGAATSAAAWGSSARSEVLRSAVEAATPAQRDMSDTARGLPALGSGRTDHGLAPEVASQWGRAFDSLDAMARTADASLAPLLGAPRAAVRFDQAPAVPRQPSDIATDTRVILSTDPVFDRLVDLEEGELPGAFVAGEPIPIALTRPVAESFGWPLGEVRSVHYSVGDYEMRLVGLVSPKNPDAGEWDHAGLALAPGVIDNFLQPPTFVGVAYADAGSLVQLTELSPAATLELWLPVDPAVLEADEADATVEALRRFASTPHDVDMVTEWGTWGVDIAFTGTTASIIVATQPLLAGVTALHLALAAGAALAGAAVLALAVRALVARRRGLLRLTAARGASDAARAGALALGSGALALVGAVPAAAVVVLTLGGSGAVAALAALVVTGIVLLAGASAAIDGVLLARSGARPDAAAGRGSRLRAAADVGVVLLAGAAAVVVALTPSTARAAAPPLAVLLAALVAAAGCVVAVRLAPLVVRVLEAAARRARGLVTLLGPARAGRDATTGAVPVLALVIAVTSAVLGSGLLATVQGGVDDATRSQMGAQLRVDARYLSPELLDALSGTEGADAVATIASDPDIRIRFPDGEGRITVFVVDPEAFARASLGALAIPDADAVVSRTVASRLAGEPLEVEGVELGIAQTVPDDGPFGRASAWIAVSPATAERLGVSPRPRAMLVSATPEHTAQLRDALARRLGEVGSVRTLDEALEARRGAPAVSALVTGTTLAVGAAAVLTVLAAVLALTAGAAGRARVFGLLRALGARSRAEYPLVLWELLPALAVAVPLGLGAGLLVLPLLTGAGDLSVFTGGGGQPEVMLGLGTSALVIAALVGVVVLGVLLAAALARRSGATDAVRLIDEEG